MAGSSIRNKVHDFGCTRSQKQKLSPLRSLSDLSDHELDQVNSALEAAANLGQPETQKKQEKKDDQKKLEAEENSLETSTSSQLDEGSSKSNSSDLFTITLNRKTRHRLEKALKLLEFIEGGGNDSDDSESDFSLNSFESSTMFLDKVSCNITTSTPRLQALKDSTRKSLKH